jgi:hypothetical protein
MDSLTPAPTIIRWRIVAVWYAPVNPVQAIARCGSQIGCHVRRRALSWRMMDHELIGDSPAKRYDVKDFAPNCRDRISFPRALA